MPNLRIMSVVGARPNFMKIAPFLRALEAANSPAWCDHFLVHTGQHYDPAMSGAFFRVLGIPEPDTDLGIGSGSHAEQVGQTMVAFEKVVDSWRPDWVVVVGDVNATCACSITARKQGVRVAHIEAGLRSFDMGMPEEINRIVTDRLSDLLFTPDAIADRNLAHEGVRPEAIRRVGNIMIDTLDRHRAQAETIALDDLVARNRLLDSSPVLLPAAGAYGVVTLHRPSNVDAPATLAALVDLLVSHVADRLPLVWTLHPRTYKRLQTSGLWERVVSSPNLVPLAPVDYLEMLRLNLGAAVMLTDSGGLQEECCVLGTPCLTLRSNTERPVTLREHGGVCELTGNDPGRILSAFESVWARIQAAPGKQGFRPPLWDGHAAERIVAAFR
jgi:UDP-N-acetylglucosamine 2-epimerase (non-hydrolysing)